MGSKTKRDLKSDKNDDEAPSEGTIYKDVAF